eukprot:CAMPEP_0185316502 /NCGR_PEP_ID=MMETSP1363-20130426/44267_1 /TAXON_ID=38817 /ORGANISM="Gephyrocapsa oceanica, Strain RCC1303" /LENGTH=216 /DNA_ID=CAMNT_0027914687 /DNA_START=185 /DNA_END=833 /DNA_ORIENTATION=+
MAASTAQESCPTTARPNPPPETDTPSPSGLSPRRGRRDLREPRGRARRGRGAYRRTCGDSRRGGNRRVGSHRTDRGRGSSRRRRPSCGGGSGRPARRRASPAVHSGLPAAAVLAAERDRAVLLSVAAPAVGGAAGALAAGDLLDVLHAKVAAAPPVRSHAEPREDGRVVVDLLVVMEKGGKAEEGAQHGCDEGALPRASAPLQHAHERTRLHAAPR